MVPHLEAFALAQQELKNAVFDKTNPRFGTRYATLASVRDAVIPVLAKHGFSIMQTPTIIDGDLFVLQTIIYHKSGAQMISNFPLPRTDNMQTLGSALTYARRYTLSAIAGIASEEDDDGEAAVANGGGRKADVGGLPPRHEPKPPAPGIVL